MLGSLGSGARPTKRPRRLAGMTLLELMVVLVILGFMLTLAPPALDGISARWRMRAAANELEATVLWSRSAAASRRTPAEIMYDVPSGAFWVRLDDGIHNLHQLPAGVRFESVRLGRDLEVANDVAACRAYPDGTVTAHEVNLIGADDRRARLTYSRLLGEPEYVEEGE